MPTTHAARRAATALAAGFLLAAGAVAPARAQTFLSSDHADIGIFFGVEDGGTTPEWYLHAHTGEEPDFVEYDPEDVVFVVPDDALTSRPASSAFDFIGVGAGQDYFRLPQTENPSLLYLGLGSEEITPGTFASYLEADPRVNATGAFLRINLVSVTGAGGAPAPGFFSVWESGDSGPRVFMSSFQNGIDATDVLFNLEGSHGHYNWGFSAPGIYDVTITASGIEAATGQRITSPAATYRFAVGAVAPEPGALALLMIPAVAGAARFLPHFARRKRSLQSA